ncbi:hypothetical protein NZL82_08810 [Sphingomonas sanguinis]|uniref:hypothetical protein n=1 Tax=Sphingomonas sp. LC-1 TaxID=3110957 RepID=UPI0021BB984D|nr:hypothetical protein [Sphingomonas sp. LC-1]MCT8001980.1 hypothetical protein [Sphingomonas sp. LC-1]
MRHKFQRAKDSKVVDISSGPAGYTAGVYAARAGLPRQDWFSADAARRKPAVRKQDAERLFCALSELWLFAQ